MTKLYGDKYVDLVLGSAFKIKTPETHFPQGWMMPSAVIIGFFLG